MSQTLSFTVHFEDAGYITENIKRFGDYPTDELAIRPAALDPRLDLSS